MNEENLIYLFAGRNGNYEINKEKPEEVELDLPKERWRLRNWDHYVNVGSSVTTHHPDEGQFLGVFDRTKDRDLELMIFMTKEIYASRSHSCADC